MDNDSDKDDIGQCSGTREKVEKAYNELLSALGEGGRNGTDGNAYGQLFQAFDNEKDAYLHSNPSEGVAYVSVIYRRLIGEARSRGLRQIAADLLADYSNFLMESGQLKDASFYMEKTVAMSRKLAADNPDLHSGELARNLVFRANIYLLTKRDEMGERDLEEALGILEFQFKKFKDADCEKSMAIVLSNLAALYGEHEKFEKCARCAAESVELFRRFSENDPSSFRADLYRGLHCLAFAHMAMGRFEEAETEESEALSIAEQYATDQEIAMSSGLLASIHNKQGKYELAEDEYCEALSCLRPLTEKLGEAIKPLLVSFLRGYSKTLKRLGREQESRKALEESEALTNIPRNISKEIADGENDACEARFYRISLTNDDDRPLFSKPSMEKIADLSKAIEALKEDEETRSYAKSIESAFLDTEFGKCLKTEPVKPSRLVITKDFKIILPDDGKTIKLERQQLALYLFFLKRVPRGYSWDEMTEDVIASYCELFNKNEVRGNQPVQNGVAGYFLRGDKGGFAIVVSRIKHRFCEILGPRYAAYYAISRDKDGVYRIHLPADLLTIEAEI